MVNFDFLKYFDIELKGIGGNPQWIGDELCDDANNNIPCDYDGGDCCGSRVHKNFCVNCTCNGKCRFTKLIQIEIINICQLYPLVVFKWLYNTMLPQQQLFCVPGANFPPNNKLYNRLSRLSMSCE